MKGKPDQVEELLKRYPELHIRLRMFTRVNKRFSDKGNRARATSSSAPSTGSSGAQDVGEVNEVTRRIERVEQRVMTELADVKQLLAKLVGGVP